jgi:hypothetical protein
MRFREINVCVLFVCICECIIKLKMNKFTTKSHKIQKKWTNLTLIFSFSSQKQSFVTHTQQVAAFFLLVSFFFSQIRKQELIYSWKLSLIFISLSLSRVVLFLSVYVWIKKIIPVDIQIPEWRIVARNVIYSIVKQINIKDERKRELNILLYLIIT